ncbi:Eukaryotic translation initiation factor 1A [Thelohanellus kitauei]|uniref:Eukaryotic translation initiation factor 1A n=1 Tax=Thelohanellus kitauei TaxID=669202 RepID=A0A0C2IF89_THEKT|nr:Eukaryotic translation initiation factor 1A [Thelohanellus kitauei]
MPKNKGKGGKNRRRGKNENDKDKRELIFKEEGQEYAQITKTFGNGYFEATTFEGVSRRSHIRGKMRKKVWINTGDLVLIGLRDFQDEAADIIAKYTSDEAATLKSLGELPQHFNVNDTNDQAQMDDQDITFDLSAPDEYKVPQQKGAYDLPPSDTESENSEREEDEEEENDESEEETS